MRLAFESDDQNDATRAVLEALAAAGHEVVRPASTTNWVDIGRAVGLAVAEGRADYGIVMCGTGTGVAIAANKVPGVRAALAWDPWIAAGARLWNDANVLAMSLRRLAPDVAVEVTDAFLAVAEAEPGEKESIDRLDPA